MANWNKNPEHAEGNFKACARCKREFPTSVFATTVHGEIRLRAYCQSCHRAVNAESALRRREIVKKHKIEYRKRRYLTIKDKMRTRELRIKYGLSREEFNEMGRLAGWKCEICSLPVREGVKGRSQLHLDHCHTTGKPRGILCSVCNTGIGKLGDNAKSLERALAYLSRAETKIEHLIPPPVAAGTLVWAIQ